MAHYLYLHGFASGPQSQKARALAARFQAQGLELEIPDLNQGDFSHLTLSRQVRQGVERVMAQAQPTVLIGSSLGGLTAAWVAQTLHRQQQRQKILQLVLLAPAFGFLDQWWPQLGPDQQDRWRRQGYLPIYHHTARQPLPLHYGFITDAQTYQDQDLQAPVPTLILHGQQDQVINIGFSRAYAADRPWVTLVELDDDHSLLRVEASLWRHTWEFLRSPPGTLPVAE
jgi:pimeloyl-ACP methyl ester carboxylesterase